MSYELIVMAAVLYWTFAAVVLVVTVATTNTVTWLEVGLATVWPLLIPIMLVAVPYQACVRSVKQIRADLQNRKLLREFEQWLRTKEQ